MRAIQAISMAAARNQRSKGPRAAPGQSPLAHFSANPKAIRLSCSTDQTTATVNNARGQDTPARTCSTTAASSAANCTPQITRRLWASTRRRARTGKKSNSFMHIV